MGRMRGTGTLLIVDDDGDLTGMLSRIAEGAGLSTLCLFDGKRVVEIAASEQPDIILLDIELPDADGRDILRALKLGPRTFHIPVFVYSGRSSHIDRIAVLELGADDYLEKPFQAQMLIRRILHGLDKARSATNSRLETPSVRDEEESR
jgi:DNA-binding response OmpR family regulator